MHAIILTSALAVTSGLFGGGRAACSSGQCGSVMPQVQSYQYTYAPTGYYQSQVQDPQYVPTAYYGTGYVYPTTYPQPVATAAAAPAANVSASAPAVAAPSQFYYYTYPAVTACPGGSCSRR